MIDCMKELKTKNGYTVSNVTVNKANVAFPISGLVHISPTIKRLKNWTLDGKHHIDKISVWDLTN